MSSRRVAIVVGAVAVAMGLAACSQSQPAASPSPAAATPSTTGGVNPVQADPAWGHIHNMMFDGDTLLLGTHDGLWRQPPAQPAVLLSQQPFDVMGLAGTPRHLLASGHAGAGQDRPADLGLIESTDGGRAWRAVSLEGEVDFHRLVNSGRTILGLSSGDGMLRRSDDNGKTWTVLDAQQLFDIAVDPTNPKTVIATTEQGPVRSANGGRTFQPIAGAPVVALLTWAGARIYAATPDGAVYRSTDASATWQRIGSVPGQPFAMAASGKRLAILADDAVMESTDEGMSFEPRITGVGDH